MEKVMQINEETGKALVAFGTTMYIRQATQAELKVARNNRVVSYAI